MRQRQEHAWSVPEAAGRPAGLSQQEEELENAEGSDGLPVLLRLRKSR